MFFNTSISPFDVDSRVCRPARISTMNPRHPPLQPLEGRRPWPVQIVDYPVKVGLELSSPRQPCGRRVN